MNTDRCTAGRATSPNRTFEFVSSFLKYNEKPP